MTMNDSILTQENNQKRANASAQPDKAAEPLPGKSEEMVKPSLLWMLVPVLLIAVAIFLAR